MEVASSHRVRLVEREGLLALPVKRLWLFALLDAMICAEFSSMTRSGKR